MPKLAVTIGTLLVIQGVGFYWASTSKSPTALIPALFGLPILVLGVVSRREAARKHAMHAAVLLAFLGLLAPLGRIASAGLHRSAAGVSLVIMVVLCGLFVALGIKSFADARRRAREPTDE